MKIRSDVVRVYRDVHSWVGILTGLALFIAFYAGAITMFEEPLQRWASPPTALATPAPLEDTPALVAKVHAEHPAARKGYEIHLVTGPQQPGRMSWSLEDADDDDHGWVPMAYASLAPDGTLQVETSGPSPVAQFVDTLHQQAGLPLSHDAAMPIVGAIGLLYVVAIVSGVIVLLPSLVRDLFAARMGRNVRRMWLDVHNLLGVFSLPFHLMMALTTIVFALHDQFYDAQGRVFPTLVPQAAARSGAEAPRGNVLPPAEIVRRLSAQAPGFTPVVLDYHARGDGAWTLRVGGTDPRHGLRAPTLGYAGVDPYDGRIVMADYLPGHQDVWAATITSFFALHFGNFGGAPIRWAYFLLGLAGAGLFYTGNLLWIESRRKYERQHTAAAGQSRATYALAALTVGVPLGSVAGISATVAAAKFAGEGATIGLHSAVYHAVFVAFVVWACTRGAARSGAELTAAAAIATLCVPLASVIAGWNGYADRPLITVDIVAISLAAVLLYASRAAHHRACHGRRDSVWAERRLCASAPAHADAPQSASGDSSSKPDAMSNARTFGGRSDEQPEGAPRPRLNEVREQ